MKQKIIFKERNCCPKIPGLVCSTSLKDCSCTAIIRELRKRAWRAQMFSENSASPMRVWASMSVMAAVRLGSWGWYRGWYSGLYWGCGWLWGWGWGLASPCDSVDEAEEDVEEPWAERLIQQSGLCKLVLTGGGGATTEDCLRVDVSSSEPDDESRRKKMEPIKILKTQFSSLVLGCKNLVFGSYLEVCELRWGTAHKWTSSW